MTKLCSRSTGWVDSLLSNSRKSGLTICSGVSSSVSTEFYHHPVLIVKHLVYRGNFELILLTLISSVWHLLLRLWTGCVLLLPGDSQQDAGGHGSDIHPQPVSFRLHRQSRDTIKATGYIHRSGDGAHRPNREQVTGGYVIRKRKECDRPRCLDSCNRATDLTNCPV